MEENGFLLPLSVPGVTGRAVGVPPLLIWQSDGRASPAYSLVDSLEKLPLVFPDFGMVNLL